MVSDHADSFGFIGPEYYGAKGNVLLKTLKMTFENVPVLSGVISTGDDIQTVQLSKYRCEKIKMLI